VAQQLLLRPRQVRPRQLVLIEEPEAHLLILAKWPRRFSRIDTARGPTHGGRNWSEPNLGRHRKARSSLTYLRVWSVDPQCSDHLQLGGVTTDVRLRVVVGLDQPM